MPRSRIARVVWSRFANVVFWMWVPVALVVGATLMVGHWYTLPRPAGTDPILVRGLEELRGPDDASKWLVAHVLYSNCRCSKRVFEHLFSSERPLGVAESVVLVGRHAEYERRAKLAGFSVTVIEPAALMQRFHLQAAPLLAVMDPAGAVRYLGGYTHRKQGTVFEDVHLVNALISSNAVSELPLFGCAVSRQLQRLLDPMKLKYRSQ